MPLKTGVSRSPTEMFTCACVCASAWLSCFSMQTSEGDTYATGRLCACSGDLSMWTLEGSSGNTGGTCVAAHVCGHAGDVSNWICLKSAEDRGDNEMAARLYGP